MPTASVIAILLVVFAAGAFAGALLATRKTRQEIKRLSKNVCYSPETLKELRRDLHKTLCEQAELCVTAASDLYKARQEDVTRYVNALNANLQLLNELSVAFNSVEAGSSPAVIEQRMAEVRKIIKEMRTILSDVSFDDLSRCLDALKDAQERELRMYQTMTKMPQVPA